MPKTEMSSSLFSDDESPPPSPVLEYPKLKLSDLADPPADWQFLGETLQVAMRARRFPKARLETIVNYQSWGIDMGLPKRATIEKLLKALWKLFYHMAPDHQPTLFDDLTDFSRDAGPRLLSYTVEIESVPISRYYPQPPAHGKALRSRFQRPSDAPESIPDSYLEQMFHPVSGGPIDLDTTEDEGDEEDAEQNQEQEERTQARMVGSSHSPLRSASSRRSISSSVFQPERYTARSLPARNVVELVQRMVMKLANADLERHHTATLIEHPCLVASNEQALLKTVERRIPATTQVRIVWNRDTDEMALHPDGRDFPYRGRGPVGSWNTSAIDCVVVAAKLLDAGSTVIDRSKNDWHAQFTPLERALIDATEVDWDLCFQGQSESLRDHFGRVVSENLAESWIGDTPWLQEVWTKATANFAQFQFTYYDQFGRCECDPVNDLGEITGPLKRSFMLPSEVPEDDQEEVTMQSRMAQEFAHKIELDCSVCDTPNAITRWRTFERLPARLAVMIDAEIPVTKHTQDLTFEAETFDKRISVTYRWVGGIYEYKGHFRVFWADNRPGEVDRGEVRMYDGANNFGIIVGGLSYGHPSERVPYEWWAGKSIPFAFYERVDNVNPQVLNTVMRSVGSMVEAVENKRLLADEVGPWASSDGMMGCSISDHPGQWVFPSADFFNHEPPVNRLASPLSEQSYPLGMQDSPAHHAARSPNPPTPGDGDFLVSSPRQSFLSVQPSALGLENTGYGENESMFGFQALDMQNPESQPELPGPATELPASNLLELSQPGPSDADLLRKYGVNYTTQNYMSDYYNQAMQIYYMMKENGNTGNTSNTSSFTYPQWNTNNMYGAPQYRPNSINQLQSVQQYPQSQSSPPTPLPVSEPSSRSHSGQGSSVGSGPARPAPKPKRWRDQRNDKKRKRDFSDRKKHKNNNNTNTNTNTNKKRKFQRFKRKKQAIRALANRQSSRLQTPEGW